MTAIFSPRPPEESSVNGPKMRIFFSRPASRAVRDSPTFRLKRFIKSLDKKAPGGSPAKKAANSSLPDNCGVHPRKGASRKGSTPRKRIGSESVSRVLAITSTIGLAALTLLFVQISLKCFSSILPKVEMIELVARPDKKSTDDSKDERAESLINSTATTMPTPREMPVRHSRARSVCLL